jgi:hypothetical protein
MKNFKMGKWIGVGTSKREEGERGRCKYGQSISYVCMKIE